MPRARKPSAGADPRGGPRQGATGRPYPNRADMRAQKVQAAPGQPYGQRGAQEAAQKVVPLPTQGGGAGPPAAAGPAGPAPGSLGDLLRPTDRPDEPITTGIASGAGLGPESLPPMGDAVLDQLRALYGQFPYEDIRVLIEDLEVGNR